MYDRVNDILKRYHINITKPRQRILEVFLQAKESVEYNYFLTHYHFKIDRTTVFRTLNLFVRKKIIYKVPATDGTKRYLLQPGNNKRQSPPGHLSFCCLQCGKATPIMEKPLLKIALPPGYKKRNIEIVINGLCNTCNS